MAVSTGKKITLLAILAVGYFISDGAQDNQKYESLKAIPPKELTPNDKAFIKKIEDERSAGETERKQHQLGKKRKEEQDSPKPLSEQELLQNEVIFTCEGIARSYLNHPDSYQRERTESGIDQQEGEKVYYFTLHYSGVNAFNVRSIYTIECYGMIGDKKHNVTYRTFN